READVEPAAEMPSTSAVRVPANTNNKEMSLPLSRQGFSQLSTSAGEALLPKALQPDGSPLLGEAG
ncbi:MAG TPA: hypothetical protein ACN46S_07115, partial [Prochlorococcus sp.]